MKKEREEVEPVLATMLENVEKSHFVDIIESKASVYKWDVRFDKVYEEFKALMDGSPDWELIFDKLECRNKLDEYLKVQLAVKVHQHELIEVRDRAVWFYQPFQDLRRRVVIESDKLTENPTVVTTKETGRLLLVGGTKGYRSSNKVFQVDECMNTLNKHSKMNFGRVGHAAVYIRNKDIYVIGGYNADSN